MRHLNKKLVVLVLVVVLASTPITLTAIFHAPSTAPVIVLPTPSTKNPSDTTLSKVDSRIKSMMAKGDLNSEAEMFVLFRGVSSSSGAELLKSLGNVTILRTYTIVSGALVKAPLGMATNIASQSYVKSVTYNYKVRVHSIAVPAASGFATAQYSANLDQIGATRLHNLGINGTGVKVAVLDTGINTHEALPASRIIYSYSFVSGEDAKDYNGHGTHVAGIIGGYGPSYTGVAPGVLLLNIKVLDKNGEGDLSDLVSGIQRAVAQGANVISISAGAEIDNPNDPVCQAANNAMLNGVVVVAAAGNEGPDGGTVNAPGEAALSICVGAVDSNNDVASFSSRGPTADYRAGVDLVAPGVNIVSLDYSDSSGYVSMSGTSQATPHVSGVAALLLSYNSSLTPVTIKAALMSTAVDLSESPYAQGNGLVNASAAYDLLASGKVPVAISPKNLELTSFNSQLSIVVNFTLIGGLSRTSYLSSVRVEVDGGISSITTLSTSGPFDLNNTQKFVSVTLYIPSSYMTPYFSGSIKLVNSDGDVLASAAIQGVGSTLYLLLFMLSQEAESFYATFAIIVGAVLIGGIVAIAVAAVIYVRRRKPPEEGLAPAPEPAVPPPFEGGPFRWPY